MADPSAVGVRRGGRHGETGGVVDVGAGGGGGERGDDTHGGCLDHGHDRSG